MPTFSRQLFSGLGILLLGILIGVVNGRWETVGDITPELQRTSSNSPGSRSSDPTSSAKAVVVNGEIHDFGTMEQSATKTHVFVIRNDGGLPLKLTKGSTTCKCTLSNVSENNIQPGETAEVKLEWTAKTSDPEFSQSAEINTNDVHRNVIRLVVKGKVRRALRGDRTDLVFGQVTVDDEATARMRIHAYLDDELAIASHEFKDTATAEKFQIQFEPLSAEEVAKEPGARAGVEMIVKLQPGLPLGPLSQAVRLTTSLDGNPTLEIPFSGRIISDIGLMGSDKRVDPDKNLVSLGTLERGESGKLTFFLIVKGSHRDSTEVQLTAADPADRLQAEVGVPLRDNPKIVRIPVVITIKEGAQPGNFLGAGDPGNTSPIGVLTFKTTHPHVPELKVKVRFLIKD